MLCATELADGTRELRLAGLLLTEDICCLTITRLQRLRLFGQHAFLHITQSACTEFTHPRTAKLPRSDEFFADRGEEFLLQLAHPEIRDLSDHVLRVRVHILFDRTGEGSRGLTQIWLSGRKRRGTDSLSDHRLGHTECATLTRHLDWRGTFLKVRLSCSRTTHPGGLRQIWLSTGHPRRTTGNHPRGFNSRSFTECPGCGTEIRFERSRGTNRSPHARLFGWSKPGEARTFVRNIRFVG